GEVGLASTFRAIARELFESASRKASIPGLESRTSLIPPINGLICSFMWLLYWRGCRALEFLEFALLDPQFRRLGGRNARVLQCVNAAGNLMASAQGSPWPPWFCRSCCGGYLAGR